jgi:5-methylcytosine-specific restriction enzyme A
MPGRAHHQCPQAGCPELTTGGYCATHARGPWHGSRHRAELPPDWEQRRLRILRRDGYQCRGMVQTAPVRLCGERATDVDAIVPTFAGGSHTHDENLQSLCRHHHLVKSGREGRAAQMGTR